jgi:hypothetical protein
MAKHLAGAAMWNAIHGSATLKANAHAAQWTTRLTAD